MPELRIQKPVQSRDVPLSHGMEKGVVLVDPCVLAVELDLGIEDAELDVLLFRLHLRELSFLLSSAHFAVAGVGGGWTLHPTLNDRLELAVTLQT